ncbi:MAG: glycosyltransferase family 1 protein [bacterium]|nr:glycosyltransferase family 1 protein [bacterium]
MRIGIDISQIVYGTGVSNYTKNLVSALLKIDKKNEYVLFGGSIRRRKELLNYNAKVFPLSPTIADFVWNRLHTLPIEWLIGKIDIFHSSDWTQPPSHAFKVTTIHDLAPLRFPNTSHPKIVAVHKRRLEWVKKEVDKIIAVSEFTKREIVELLNIEEDRIVVIHEAPNPAFKEVPMVEVLRTLKRYGVKGEYILVVGADPRKNISAIIQAFKLLKSKLSLVIVGRAFEEIPTTSGVTLLGHIPHEDLAALYSGAKALCFASLYEGFGLPILEAMQAGCPVVTSNLSSMPEVAGDAAVLVDPTDPREIAKGLEKVMSEREVWIKRGIERAKKFSWEKTAEETLRVYMEVIKQ